MDVAAWLEGLGLARYAPAFRDNEIDWETLPKLTAEDLKDLGVVLGGHRRKLLDAIAALDPEAPAAGTAASRDAPAPADAERRQLTVMFCDLVGSTELRRSTDDVQNRGGGFHFTAYGRERSKGRFESGPSSDPTKNMMQNKVVASIIGAGNALTFDRG